MFVGDLLSRQTREGGFLSFLHCTCQYNIHGQLTATCAGGGCEQTSVIVIADMVRWCAMRFLNRRNTELQNDKSHAHDKQQYTLHKRVEYMYSICRIRLIVGEIGHTTNTRK